MGNFKKFMAMAAVSCMALTTMTACGNSGDAAPVMEIQTKSKSV